MALGVCPECDKLVAITPGALLPNRGRARAWVPVAHTIVPHKCGGAIVDGACAKCGEVGPEPAGDATTCLGKPITK